MAQKCNLSSNHQLFDSKWNDPQEPQEEASHQEEHEPIADESSAGLPPATAIPSHHKSGPAAARSNGTLAAAAEGWLVLPQQSTEPAPAEDKQEASTEVAVQENTGECIRSALSRGSWLGGSQCEHIDFWLDCGLDGPVKEPLQQLMSSFTGSHA